MKNIARILDFKTSLRFTGSGEPDNLEQLRKAICSNNLTEVYKIAKELPANCLSRDFLVMAINSANAGVVRAIVPKTRENAFDKDILLISIDMGYYNRSLALKSYNLTKIKHSAGTQKVSQIRPKIDIILPKWSVFKCI